MRRRLLALLQAAVVLVAVGLAVLRFAAIDATSHSASDTLRPWLIQAGTIALVACGIVLLLRRAPAGRDSATGPPRRRG